jgi:hypothetical protein
MLLYWNGLIEPAVSPQVEISASGNQGTFLRATLNVPEANMVPGRNFDIFVHLVPMIYFLFMPAVDFPKS